MMMHMDSVSYTSSSAKPRQVYLIFIDIVLVQKAYTKSIKQIKVPIYLLPLMQSRGMKNITTQLEDSQLSSLQWERERTY